MPKKHDEARVFHSKIAKMPDSGNSLFPLKYDKMEHK